MIKPNTPATTATLSGSIAAAIGYMAGIDWQLSSVDWPAAIPWMITFATVNGWIGDTAYKKTSPDIKL